MEREGHSSFSPQFALSAPVRSGAQASPETGVSGMSLDVGAQAGSRETPMYVYESTVHCANVLLSLEDQRRLNILCDVTVVVEGTEIRAHRAVLAASSRYFLQVLLGHTHPEQEPIISLSDKVTARGFAPLLQFAYTAKLVLSRENIHEVIRCADFLGVHNLEDSCFRFLQAQLHSDTTDHNNGLLCRKELPSSAHTDDLITEDDGGGGGSASSETPRVTSSSAMRWRPNHSTLMPLTSSLTSDLPRCAKYRKYQQACAKHNGETEEDDSVTSATSSRCRASASPGRSETSITRQGEHPLSPSRIKEEPRSGGEGEGSPPGLSEDSQNVLEMELELEGGPGPSARPPSRGSPSCLRSYLQRGLLDLSNPASTLPSTPPTQQLLTNRISLAHNRDRDRGASQGEGVRDLGAVSTGAVGLSDGDMEGVVEDMAMKPLVSNGVIKQEVELDRRSSVIFSPGACDHLGTSSQSYSDRKSLEKDLLEITSKSLWTGVSQSLPCRQTYSPLPSSTTPSTALQDPLPTMACRPRPTTSCPLPIKISPCSPACEPCTRTTSSCSSFSYLEDGGSGDSPSSLPQFELSSSPCSVSGSGLVGEQREHGGMVVGEAIFSQGRTKIKCERTYGANSSDESGSFSEGDSDSGPAREPGPEVHDKDKLLSERNQLKVCMGELWQNLSYLSQAVSQEVCREVQGNHEKTHALLPTHRPRVPTATTNSISIMASIDLTSNPGSPTSEGSQVKSPCPSESPMERDVGPGQRRQGGGETDVSVLGQEDPESSLEPGASTGVCSPTVLVDFSQEMTEKCTTEEQPGQDCI
ncbi:unnamed protein product [Coregonus sp. 'balchen']|nr:unnamed protein product [Coregonus sp. 'balchen']